MAVACLQRSPRRVAGAARSTTAAATASGGSGRLQVTRPNRSANVRQDLRAADKLSSVYTSNDEATPRRLHIQHREDGGGENGLGERRLGRRGGGAPGDLKHESDTAMPRRSPCRIYMHIKSTSPLVNCVPVVPVYRQAKVRRQNV